tara:strand:+ start:403 stop:624 length:222 start_codon:yes stop_codon:yes gene_type:complete
VSVEKVVATIEIPNSHQGIFLPERKYSLELDPDFLDTIKPIVKVIEKKHKIIRMSRFESSIIYDKNYASFKVK